MNKIIELNSLIEFYENAYFPMADSKYSDNFKFYKPKLRFKLDNLTRDRQAIFDDEEDKEDEDYNIDEFIAELILEANPQLGNSEDEYDLRELTIAVRDALNYEYPMIKNLT